MGWFEPKIKKTDKGDGWSEINFLHRNRCKVFETIDVLTNQAETHFENENFYLCESILDILIKYVERNKSVKFVKSIEEESPLDIVIRRAKERIVDTNQTENSK